jgi:capsular polysaccharide export protein
MSAANGTRPADRHFLFLQGPSSPIFRKIGMRLAARGHKVSRVNICAGDWIFWHGPGTTSYRGRPAAWSRFIEDICARRAITDLVLLGEERPYHKVAAAICRRRGIDVYVVEMGYLRPDWLTLERDGMSTNSHFPNDPQRIVAAAKGLPDPDLRPRYAQRFSAEALSDLAFNLPNVFFWFLYPHYRPHAIDHPLAEYAGWLRKLLAMRRTARRAQAAAKALAGRKAPFFLFPLQLETDYQIRAHSPFSSQREALEHVARAFARGAPGDRHLVVKAHPLDNGLRDWSAMCREIAARHGLSERVHYLAHGDLAKLVDGARGVVTVNSTVGIHALLAGLPVRVLGTAVFDVAGLTDRQSLPDFFRQPASPDPEIRDAFLRLLAATVQVRGNFYSRAGSEAGAEAIAKRLCGRLVNEPGGFVPLPPRAKLARAESGNPAQAFPAALK